MANHKATLKSIRKSEKRRTENAYYHKTARNAVRDLRKSTDKKEAETMLPKVASILDKLAKKNVIHSKKADNLKSKLAKHVGSL